MEIGIEEVYREVAPKLMSYLEGNGCSYAVSCDIVEETFLRLLNLQERIRWDMHEVSGLAFTIARNYRNDLARKARHEQIGAVPDDDGSYAVSSGPVDTVRPGEDEDEIADLRRRLRATLGRMPVKLLEIFALSRLGKMTVKEIAGGTGVSESNVKVRVHRARELFKSCFEDAHVSDASGGRSADVESALLKAMMMLSAVDGEIAKEELAIYRRFAEGVRSGEMSEFGGLWEDAVRSMAYIGFLTDVLPPERIVREYVREVESSLDPVRQLTDDRRGRFVSVLERLAAADGRYTPVERACVRALAKELEGD